eukprot:351387-Amphidinium_carterae.1
MDRKHHSSKGCRGAEHLLLFAIQLQFMMLSMLGDSCQSQARFLDLVRVKTATTSGNPLVDPKKHHPRAKDWQELHQTAFSGCNKKCWAHQCPNEMQQDCRILPPTI